MFETESLLNESEQITGYRKYCAKVVQYTVIETYYIFTVCNLMQSNDQKTFYRERVLHMSLRMLYLLADIKEKIDRDVFGTEIELRSIADLQDYLSNLQGILLARVKAYELVNPLEVLIAEK